MSPITIRELADVGAYDSCLRVRRRAGETGCRIP